MLPAVVKNKIEQIWLDVIAGGVSQPTEVIEQLTYLMFAKQLDEKEADIETAELLLGQKQEHLFGETKEEQALRWRNFKGMEARELHKHFVEHVFVFMINLNSDKNSSFSRYLKHATFKINEPLALQKVIAGLEDLFENDIKGLDMQGDLYEYMLGKLNSAGRLGAFRTPKHIRDMMVELMAPTPDSKICEIKTRYLIQFNAA
jgi:type I restriction enzyme M protein